MFFHIDSQNGVPVYEQVARQVKFAIADAVVAPGDLLPSVRDLARELALNPNTIARAYRELQNDGLVEHAAGIGLSVKPGTRRECQVARRKLLQERIRQAVEEAFLAGLDAEAVERLASAEVNRLRKTHRKTKGTS